MLDVLCKVHVGGGESYSQLLSQLEGGNVVELGPLGTDLAWSLLQHQLAAINRTLTNYQNRCSLLFFSIWKSTKLILISRATFEKRYANNKYSI
jgi:hypothetical protein